MDAMFGVAPYAVIENVVVTATARARGVGASLLHRVYEIAREGFDPDRKRGFVRYLPSPPLAILAE